MTHILTQEEETKLVYWRLSDDYISPSNILFPLIRQMEYNIQLVQQYDINRIFEYGVHTSYYDYENDVVYYYFVADPWTWSRFSPHIAALNIATGNLKVKKIKNISDNAIAIGDIPKYMLNQD